MERIKNIFEITQRLCGMIQPAGDSSIDEIRHENLVDTIDVTEKLIDSIVSVTSYKDDHRASMSKSGKTANAFVDSLIDKFGISDENLWIGSALQFWINVDINNTHIIACIEGLQSSLRNNRGSIIMQKEGKFYCKTWEYGWTQIENINTQVLYNPELFEKY